MRKREGSRMPVAQLRVVACPRVELHTHADTQKRLRVEHMLALLTQEQVHEIQREKGASSSTAPHYLTLPKPHAVAVLPIVVLQTY